MSNGDQSHCPYTTTLTQQQQSELRSTVQRVLAAAEHEVEVGPLHFEPILGRPGIWITLDGQPRLLGSSWEAAMVTARMGDWFYPPWHGRILIDDLDWYELRPQLGDDWEDSETPIHQQESNKRRLTNLGFISSTLTPEQLSACVPIKRKVPPAWLFQVVKDRKRYEVLRFAGWPGYWCLDSLQGLYCRVELVVTNSSFQIHVLPETRTADDPNLPPRELVALLIQDEDKPESLLKLYREGIVFMTLRQHGLRTIVIKELRLS